MPIDDVLIPRQERVFVQWAVATAETHRWSIHR